MTVSKMQKCSQFLSRSSQLYKNISPQDKIIEWCSNQLSKSSSVSCFFFINSDCRLEEHVQTGVCLHTEIDDVTFYISFCYPLALFYQVVGEKRQIVSFVEKTEVKSRCDF